jgi:hypothetical protein
MKKYVVVILMLTSSAFAQQESDPDFLSKALVVVQRQRTEAADRAAGLEARVMQLSEANTKLKAEIEELKKKKE